VEKVITLTEEELRCLVDVLVCTMAVCHGDKTFLRELATKLRDEAEKL
jgi:hypothetical protein